jgi:hypothetical protein
MKHKFLSAVAAAFCGFFLCVHPVDAQGTAFTYQGSLDINGLPANGYYDFEFTLFGQSVLGSPASPTLTNANVLVTGGLFTTTLDFGADILAVTNNYLDIAVCTNGSDAFVELSPRQLLTTAPYAATALTAANLAGVLANNSVQPGAAAATISGGSGNVIQNSANGATIGGGTQNVIETNNDYSTVSGGGGNTIEDGSFYSSIAGGFGNTVQGNASGCAIAGTDNSIDFGAYSSVIGGGEHNEINANSAGCAIAGGGYGAIGFGVNFGTIAGGYGNVILDGSGFAALGGGRQNTNEGNYSTIPGGSQNVAGGDYSFAAGLQAKALHQGSFVWADAEASPFSSTAADQFLVRASGGVGINMNNPGGASLYAQGNRAGGSFSDAVSIFENTSAATGTSGSGPALRVVVDGGSCPAGALSVSDNGSGPIAEFGNSLSDERPECEGEFCGARCKGHPGESRGSFSDGMELQG